MTSAARRLLWVKLLHTVAWAFFVACIIVIPIYGWSGQYGLAAVFTAIVFGEVVVLALNGWRCPLTAVAAQYTDDRIDNFDIFLPVWLARYNKEIFGTLFVGGVLFTFGRWFGWFG